MAACPAELPAPTTIAVECRQFEGAGVYYSATSVEARMCRDSTAIVVGGGNSAGQAAMFLSQHAREVK
ncbi:MAG: hypothetical protein AAF961_08535, partial [Planctomycetota bacterium]